MLASCYWVVLIVMKNFQNLINVFNKKAKSYIKYVFPISVYDFCPLSRQITNVASVELFGFRVEKNLF